MYGLTLEQEAALAVVWCGQDDLPLDLTNVNITPSLLYLRKIGYLEMQTDWNNELAFVQSLLLPGMEHYDNVIRSRRRFKEISNESDELLGILAAQEEASKKGRTIFSDALVANRIAEYRELSQAGLLSVFWADNCPYHVSITNDGKTYLNGWFLDRESNMNINVSPVINNSINGATAQANSVSSSSISGITLGSTIQAILDLDIEFDKKEEAEKAVKELDAASKEKDKVVEFSSHLETVAHMAKSAVSLAKILLPFAQKALETFLQ